MKKIFLILFNFIVLLTSFNTIASENNAITTFEQSLKANQGKVIYVDFWASWCKPCRKSFPWMNEIQKKYQQDGFTVISINLDSDKANAEAFLATLPANFPVIYDPKGLLAKKFKLPGMPSSFLLDKNGELKSSHVGFNSQDTKKYEQEIAQLLMASQ